MDVKEVDFWGWKGVSLTTERVSIIVTPEPGGRIMSLMLDGVEVLFGLEELRGRRIDLSGVSDVRAKKRELGWLHYGGHKTWLAPQTNWTDALPFLDLDSGSYDLAVEGGSKGQLVQLTSPIDGETGIQLTRSVSVSEGSRVEIQNGMINRSTEETSWGVWGVTQVNGPGMAVIPINRKSAFPVGVKAYAGEGRSQEVMDQYVKLCDGLAVITCQEVEQFKYGTDSTDGWILALLDQGKDHWLAFMKIFSPTPGAAYPHGTTAEVYDSPLLPYFEMEVHSPIQTLAPGEAYSHKETWVLDWLPKSSNMVATEEWVKENLLRSKGSRQAG